MMGYLVIILVICFSNPMKVLGFEEEIEGYIVGQPKEAKEVIETQSVIKPSSLLQLAASRQVLEWKKHPYFLHSHLSFRRL